MGGGGGGRGAIYSSILHQFMCCKTNTRSEQNWGVLFNSFPFLVAFIDQHDIIYLNALYFITLLLDLHRGHACMRQKVIVWHQQTQSHNDQCLIKIALVASLLWFPYLDINEASR